MRIEDSIKLDFSDVLIKPKRSRLGSRKDVNLERSYSFLHSEEDYRGIPIIAANMDHTGTFEMADALVKSKLDTALHKHYSVDEYAGFFQKYLDINHSFDAQSDTHTWYSMGILPADLEKFNEVVIASPLDITHVCIDVANGYSENMLNFVRKFRKANEHVTIMAGNVVTAEMTEALILAGADIVKTGIGPGSVCTTRHKTGVGYPQLSAIMECADAAHGLGGHVCADGGCTSPGDVAKAFAAGADFVMLGGMLAGHEECSGEVIQDTEGTMTELGYREDPVGPKRMKFYGMSSKEAQDKHGTGLKDYRASEGKCVEVPFKGNVADTVQEIMGGLRSTCTYVGAKTLKQLSKCTTFIRVNNQINNVFGEPK